MICKELSSNREEVNTRKWRYFLEWSSFYREKARFPYIVASHTLPSRPLLYQLRRQLRQIDTVQTQGEGSPGTNIGNGEEALCLIKSWQSLSGSCYARLCYAACPPAEQLHSILDHRAIILRQATKTSCLTPICEDHPCPMAA